MVDQIIVRAMTAADAPDVTRLLEQLGYPWPERDITARIDAFLARGEHALVAVRAPGGRLLGVLTLHITPVLHRAGPVGRLTMLVVDESARGEGIGRALVTEAEKYFTVRGCALVEVTSNKKRAGAHAFYERLGYVSTSDRFVRTLNS